LEELWEEQRIDVSVITTTQQTLDDIAYVQ